MGSGKVLEERTAFHPLSKILGNLSVPISFFTWLLHTYILLRIVTPREILMVLKMPLVSLYNLRDLDEISTKHTSTEGDLGMDFPEGTVLTLYSVLEESCHNAEESILSPECTRNTRSQILLFDFPLPSSLSFHPSCRPENQTIWSENHDHMETYGEPTTALCTTTDFQPLSTNHHMSHLSNADGSHQTTPRLATHWIATGLGRHNSTQANHIFATKAIQGMTQSWQNLGGFRTTYWKPYFNFRSAPKLSSSWTGWWLQAPFGLTRLFYSMPFFLVSPPFPRSTHWCTRYSCWAFLMPLLPFSSQQPCGIPLLLGDGKNQPCSPGTTPISYSLSADQG